ncbi:MAG: pyridoxamine 5'-phosphate oxidase family protein [Geobacter sp.]|nr:pyridoxamine 5'-phosphate oxidase family protein [Geobacter sp.]
MSAQLTNEIIDLLKDKETTKVLATLDADGFPHAVVKQSLQPGEDGNILYLELLESSRTNKNLVRSIWFDRKVAIALKGKDGRSWQIKGKPVKTHITGPLFQKHYTAVRKRLGDVDLAAVWVIEPEEVIEETFAARRAEEERKHPLFTHLDRLARQ